MRSGFACAALLASMLAGCGNLSGLDAQSSFSCKAPAGVSCQSISGTYANAAQNNLPFQRRGNETKNAGEPGPKPTQPVPTFERVAKLSPRNMEAPDSGMPIRQPPLVLRLWIAPWEDDLGDLHDQAYFYTMVHPGKWMIEANRTAISNQFHPVYPLKQRGVADEVPPAEKQSVNPLAARQPTDQAPGSAPSGPNADPNRE